MSESTTDTPVLEAVPFELMNKADRREHLQTYHQNWTENRTTMERLEGMHNSAHGQHGRITIAHEHTPIQNDTPTGIKRDLSAPLATPLNAAERKALKDLVDNDFRALRAEIAAFASDMATKRRNEILAEWEARTSRKQEFLDRVLKLRNQYQEAVKLLRQESDAAGIDLTCETGGYTPTAKVKGLQEALRQADSEIVTERQRAEMTLERQRLTAQRQVLLAGISAEALALLGEIPTAKELMTKAALERANKAIEAKQAEEDEDEEDPGWPEGEEDDA